MWDKTGQNQFMKRETISPENPIHGAHAIDAALVSIGVVEVGTRTRSVVGNFVDIATSTPRIQAERRLRGGTPWSDPTKVIVTIAGNLLSEQD